MPAYIKQGGAFKAAKALWVKQGGVFKSISHAWVKQGGVWKQYWPPVVPGNTVITGDWVVPLYNSLTIEVRGAGGGGGGGHIDSAFVPGSYGGTGGQGTETKFDSTTPLIATGGYGGGGGGYCQGVHGCGGGTGGNGGGSGGTVTVGGGSAGGAGGPRSGSSPGRNGGPGGQGGKVTHSWNVGDAGAPVPGTTIHVVIGAGGAGAGGGGGTGDNGAAGWIGAAWQ